MRKTVRVLFGVSEGKTQEVTGVETSTVFVGEREFLVLKVRRGHTLIPIDTIRKIHTEKPLKLELIDDCSDVMHQ